MSWRERLGNVVESVRNIFTERDLDFSPFQEPEASGSAAADMQNVQAEEPSIVSAQDEREHQNYLEQAQVALEWVANMRHQFPGNEAVDTIGDETAAYAKFLLDPEMPLDWKADHLDDMQRSMADLDQVLHPGSEPDIVSESAWQMDDQGAESKVYIGQDEDGYHYAREVSPVMDEEESLRWHGPYPTEGEAESAAYGGGHHADVKASSSGEEQQEQAVLSDPEAQSSQVADEEPNR